MANLGFLIGGSSHTGGGQYSLASEFAPAMLETPANVVFRAKSLGGTMATALDEQGSTVGPEVQLVHRLAAMFPNDTIYFGKFSKGGVEIQEFQRPGRTMYDLGLEVVTALDAPCDIEWKCLFHAQGTADRGDQTQARQWDARMNEYLDGSQHSPGYRAELATPGLGCIAAKVDFITQNPAYMSDLMDAFSDWENGSANNHTLGTKNSIQGLLGDDGIHLRPEGNYVLGELFFAGFRSWVA